jgi:2-dehydro-3-deoxyphosphogluconate aldolase/(4S)-4-hydroxy-2-oxoglutarate aldolase
MASHCQSTGPTFQTGGLDGEAFPQKLVVRLESDRVIAVITVDTADEAVLLGRALVAGGVRVMELAWRTSATLEALAAIVQDVPEMLAGVGTLLSPEQVQAAADAGAEFGVSPGMSAAVVRAARTFGLPFAPGVQTPSDVQAAVEQGCRLLKFFPAESAGGLTHLRNLNAPFAHLGLRYIALGGIDQRTAPAYLAEPCVAAIGGSWIAPSVLVRQGAWEDIRQNAAAARALATRFERIIV